MSKLTDRRTDEFVNRISDESPSTLFVTDAEGNILISNEFTALTIGIPLEELLHYNVQDLVKSGYYSDSITMLAIESREKVSRVVKTIRGFNVLSTATPILNKAGEIELVVTSSTEYKGDLSKLLPPPVPPARNHRKESTSSTIRDTGIIAESTAMKQIIHVCNQIASYDSKVLIMGESGTGKEVIAKYIHRKSDKWNGPFIPINCAAIPANSFEYELFGWEQGVGGAAEEKKGMFELACGGVLFLDEIAEIPLDMQAKLLHVLESSEVRRIGGTTPRPINCRIVCATNRDLWNMVKKRQFREDLYYRINVIPIHIPPLRSRKRDLVGLTSSFIAHFNKVYRKKYVLRADEFQEILNQPWHGNARELRNYVERLVLTNRSVSSEASAGDCKIEDSFALDHFIVKNQEHIRSLKHFTALIEGQYINQVLQECRGNAAEAAKRLGIDRSVIYRKLKKMDEALHDED